MVIVRQRWSVVTVRRRCLPMVEDGVPAQSAQVSASLRLMLTWTRQVALHIGTVVSEEQPGAVAVGTVGDGGGGGVNAGM